MFIILTCFKYNKNKIIKQLKVKSKIWFKVELKIRLKVGL